MPDNDERAGRVRPLVGLDARHRQPRPRPDRGGADPLGQAGPRAARAPPGCQRGAEKVDIQVWEYLDGRPCEIFVGARKSGTLVACDGAAYFARDPGRDGDPAQILRWTDDGTLSVVYESPTGGPAYIAGAPRCGGDRLTVNEIIERVDGMFLVVSKLIEDFAIEMQKQVDKAADSAQDALGSANRAYGYSEEMREWLDNAGFPFWKGTQAEFDALDKKREFLYLIVEG